MKGLWLFQVDSGRISRCTSPSHVPADQSGTPVDEPTPHLLDIVLCCCCCFFHVLFSPPQLELQNSNMVSCADWVKVRATDLASLRVSLTPRMVCTDRLAKSHSRNHPMWLEHFDRQTYLMHGCNLSQPDEVHLNELVVITNTYRLCANNWTLLNSMYHSISSPHEQVKPNINKMDASDGRSPAARAAGTSILGLPANHNRCCQMKGYLQSSWKR